MKKSMTDKLKEYLSNKNREELDKDYNEIQETIKDIDSQLVEYFLKWQEEYHLNNNDD